MKITAYDLAMRYAGTAEVAGVASNPLILAILQLDTTWPKDDSVPWCSAFVNWIAWNLRLPRSKALNARSWLEVGTPVRSVDDAIPGFDVVVLSRGTNPEAGHVGFFGGVTSDRVNILGGNQGDKVGLAQFPRVHVVGIRRLWSNAA